MLRRLLALTTATALAGCASTTKISRTDLAALPPRLSRQAAVHVALPMNGFFKGAEYKASGSHTSQAIAAAFAPFASRVDRADVVESNSAAMLRARSANCAYCVAATILHWEDRNTEWSGRSDVVCVRIALFDAATGLAIDDVKLDGKSKWATFGGDHPQDLLTGPIREYVAALYGEAPPPVARHGSAPGR